MSQKDLERAAELHREIIELVLGLPLSIHPSRVLW